MTKEKDKTEVTETKDFELLPDVPETVEIPVEDDSPRPPESVIIGMCEAFENIMQMMNSALAREGIADDNITAVCNADLGAGIESLETMCREIMSSATGCGSYIGLVRGIVSAVILSPVKAKIEEMRRIQRERLAG
jgi:hypothetical protein